MCACPAAGASLELGELRVAVRLEARRTAVVGLQEGRGHPRPAQASDQRGAHFWRAVLARALRGHPALTSLSLGDNSLGDDGVEALSIGLKESKSLTMLDLSNKEMFSTKFGPKGATALASAIAVMGSLTEVC